PACRPIRICCRSCAGSRSRMRAGRSPPSGAQKSGGFIGAPPRSAAVWAPGPRAPSICRAGGKTPRTDPPVRRRGAVTGRAGGAGGGAPGGGRGGFGAGRRGRLRENFFLFDQHGICVGGSGAAFVRGDLRLDYGGLGVALGGGGLGGACPPSPRPPILRRGSK